MYYKSIKEYARQVPKPAWPPKSEADNTTDQAPHSQQTTQAWEAYVLYDHQGVWPTSAQASKCPNL